MFVDRRCDPIAACGRFSYRRAMATSQQKTISIQGAREHNLKDVSLEIPRDELIVFTGLSGSGKSSLAFDTIYAEGQRRYVESLSAYARQFLELMQKPDVDQIDGLSQLEGVIVRDDDLGLLQVGKHVVGNQLTLFVIAVRVVGLKNAQTIFDRQARRDNGARRYFDGQG